MFDIQINYSAETKTGGQFSNRNDNDGRFSVYFLEVV